jgi:hypothetical protein
MPHQDGFGDNGPEATGLSKPDDGDDGMQKKSENIAHAPDGIKLKNLKNSVRLRNSPTTAPRGIFESRQWRSIQFGKRRVWCLDIWLVS